MDKLFWGLHLVIGALCVVQLIETINNIFIKKRVVNKGLSTFVFISSILLIILYIPMVISGEENSYMFLFGSYILLNAISNKNNIKLK